MAERFVPNWHVERHHDRGGLLLRNDNGESAYHVTISADPWYFIEGRPDHPEIRAGSSVAFLLTTDEQVDWDTMIRVRWSRTPDGTTHEEWRTPVLWQVT